MSSRYLNRRRRQNQEVTAKVSASLPTDLDTYRSKHYMHEEMQVNRQLGRGGAFVGASLGAYMNESDVVHDTSKRISPGRRHVSPIRAGGADGVASILGGRGGSVDMYPSVARQPRTWPSPPRQTTVAAPLPAVGGGGGVSSYQLPQKEPNSRDTRYQSTYEAASSGAAAAAAAAHHVNTRHAPPPKDHVKEINFTSPRSRDNNGGGAGFSGENGGQGRSLVLFPELTAQNTFQELVDDVYYNSVESQKTYLTVKFGGE